MINLIKMDLYRMVHSICTWVMLLVTVGIALFCVAMVNIDLEDKAENPQYSEETSQMGIVSFQIEVKTQDAQEETEETENSEEEQQIGLYADSDPGWIEGQILAGDLISTQLESGILTLLCVIFAAIFFNGDQRNGFLKNIAGQYPNRGILVISKMTAAAVQILLMEILFAMATGVTAEIIWGEQFVLGSIPQMLPFLCVQYLLNLGAAGLILLLCTLTRSAAFGMTAGILMIMGILLPVYSVIERAFAALLPSLRLNISQYVLEGNIGVAGMEASSDILTRASMVGAVCLVLSVLLAMVIMKKRDIR
ncbi:MAG TPA: ABC transporter permease [Candidatus Limivivens merdigallinarum]|uniref:ABC transporter permease n=1 Tax=Candidatus Limivivens merdigallinarum TaxID=2840859 RepID=A0A9D0ZWC5_9FIRM|nr:ABC transporter permease [Candidatus Limivivens merdigallinarum]